MGKKVVQPLEEMEKETIVDRKVFSFFVLAFPTILIVLFSMLAPELWWANILLAVFQFILLKQFLDDYYKYKEE